TVPRPRPDAPPVTRNVEPSIFMPSVLRRARRARSGWNSGRREDASTRFARGSNVYWPSEPTRAPRGSPRRAPRRPGVPVRDPRGSPRDRPRQRPPRPPPGGPPEPGRQLPDLVQGRLARRASGSDGPVPLPRAHDVQGDADPRPPGLLEADRVSR